MIRKLWVDRPTGRVEDWRGAQMSPSPAPASSNGADGFPVRRSPVCFASWVMRPIDQERFRAQPNIGPGNLRRARAVHGATPYSTSSSRISLRRDVDPPPQVLQTHGRRCHAAPASRVVGGSADSRVPSLHGHYPVSSLLRTRPPPSRRRTISRVPRLYARPDSADFAAGRGGFLQLLDAPVSPCCRSKPRRSAPPRQPDCDGPCGLRGVLDRSGSGVGICRGHLTFTCVTAR